MNPYKAIERIGWRFSQGKTFIPNENDIEAYNGLVEFFENYQKRDIMENKLFGKFYIYFYRKYLEHYHTDPTDPIPQKELNKVLEMRFDRLLADLTESINSICLERDIAEGIENPVKRWDIERIRYEMNLQIAKVIERWK